MVSVESGILYAFLMIFRVKYLVTPIILNDLYGYNTANRSSTVFNFSLSRRLGLMGIDERDKLG